MHLDRDTLIFMYGCLTRYANYIYTFTYIYRYVHIYKIFVYIYIYILYIVQPRRYTGAGAVPNSLLSHGWSARITMPTTPTNTSKKAMEHIHELHLQI